MLTRVDSTEALITLVNDTRALSDAPITNFYFNADRHPFWIKDGSLYYQKIKACLFLLHQEANFYHLFFIAPSVASLCDSMTHAEFIKYPLSIDLLGPEGNPLKEALEACGFKLFQTLRRMRRIGAPSEYQPSDEVHEADIANVPELSQLLHTHFDARFEQLPGEKELELYTLRHQILVYQHDGTTCGFIIYEKQGKTLYLRYWWVAPSYRNLGIGAKLFHTFFANGKETLRQLHWLRIGNDSARVCYEHYGYTFEALYDYVLINNL